MERKKVVNLGKEMGEKPVSIIEQRELTGSSRSNSNLAKNG